VVKHAILPVLAATVLAAGIAWQISRHSQFHARTIGEKFAAQDAVTAVRTGCLDSLRGILVASVEVSELKLDPQPCTGAATGTVPYHAVVRMRSLLGIPVGTALVQCGSVLSCR
jgi:hypothetical protein